ncbi:hypothetical protein SFRURICE_017118 [Spodoptera frugiperda]|nr:hypothetical protein SFRURICE_017118 [Spodoptera frugiperda]
MEPGFVKADSNNLPRIDAIMLGRFFASNNDFCSSEFRNIKTSMSSRASYGDDAVSYVQLKRENKFCTVKCKICPEHKVHANYMDCQDCVASQGGCKHAIAFLMWVHRRSENHHALLWSAIGRNPNCLKLKRQEREKLRTVQLLKYQPTYSESETWAISMHQLTYKFKERCVEDFLKKIEITASLIKKVEEETREQSNSALWFELRYGRITASRAFEVSRCKTSDGTLISLILGGKIPDIRP